MAAMVAALLLSTVYVTADEPVLIREESSGTAQLDGQRVLAISHIRGTMFIRLGTPGEVRFAARLRDNRREEHPVALWLVDETLEFRPVEGLEETVLLLEVAVPPELSLEIVTEDSLLTLSGLRGDVKVAGERLAIEGHGLTGPIEVELVDSTIKLSDVEKSLDFEGRAVKADLSRIQGDLSLSASDSEIELDQIKGEIDADLDGTSLEASFLQRRVELDANGGKIRLSDLQFGAQLRLEDTPVELFRVLGTVEVETNAETRFQDLDCELVIHGYGASVRGSGSLRSLKVTTDSAQVRVENIGANLFIDGDHLEVYASGVNGEVGITVSSSGVQLENTSGLVRVENDYGDIVIRKATKKVTVTSLEGNVTITELAAPLALEANGDRVEVRWSDTSNEDSVVHNEGGEVWILLPLKWVGTVEAETDFGRIESNINGVAVSDGGKQATGVVRRRVRPRLSIKSGGDVFLNSSVPGQQDD